MSSKSIRVAQVELSDSPSSWQLPLLPPMNFVIQILVRLHTAPLGMVELTGDEAAVDPERSIVDKFGPLIHGHLSRDGLGDLGEARATNADPGCLAARRELLSDAPALTVIIPTRDRPERLSRCLTSVLATDYPNEARRIIVVDNVPTDDATERVVREFPADANITYLRECSSGSASARNRAMPEVNTPYVVFTDDDAMVDVHWLSELMLGFSSAAQVNVVTGLLLPGDMETSAQLWFEQYGGFSRGFDRRVFDMSANVPRDVPLYPFSAGIFGTGNNMAFRTESLCGIGCFDPALGNGTPALGGVDSEVLLRSVVLGHRLVYQPSAVVYHEHRREYDALRRQVFSYGAGLTAYLIRTLTHNPRLIPSFIRVFPRGVLFALKPSSQLNVQKRADYPRQLTWDERRGMAYGLLGYVRSRRAYGPHRQSSDGCERSRSVRMAEGG